MLRYLYRLIAWSVPRLPGMYRARIFKDLANRTRVSEIVCTGPLGRFHGLPADEFVLMEYRESGEYSVHVRKVLDALLATGGTLIDVGANIGLTSIPTAKRHGVTCHAFEPEPENHRLLKLNVSENEVSQLVHVYPFALGTEDGTLTLERSETNLGDHRLRIGAPAGGAYQEQNRTTVAVQVRRLDGVLDVSRLTGPVVMKIDVQGAEAKVFSGASEVLDRCDFVVAELWPYGLLRMGDSPDTFFSTMKRFPFAGIANRNSGGMPPLARTTEVIEQIRREIPLDGSDPKADLDVILARRSTPQT
jgi:FkbM family methyltransferase